MYDTDIKITMDSISECRRSNWKDSHDSILECWKLRIPSENALKRSLQCHEKSCPLSKVCPFPNRRQPCINTREQKGDLEEDGEGGEDERHLLGAGEDAVLPLEQLLPPVEGAVGGAEDEAEPADVGLEEAELPPGEGGGDGGEGGEAEQDGKGVSDHAGHQVAVDPPVPIMSWQRNCYHL